MEKKVIFVGSNDVEVLNGMKQLFPEHNVLIMDKDIYNKTNDNFIQKHVKWKEDQAIHEWVKKEENIKMAHEMLSNLLATVGEGMFSVKEIVEKTNFSYKQATSMLDVLYVFGLVAKQQDSEGREFFMIVNDPQKKHDYLEQLISVKQSEVDSIKVILEKVKQEVIDWNNKKENEQLSKTVDAENKTVEGQVTELKVVHDDKGNQ